MFQDLCDHSSQFKIPPPFLAAVAYERKELRREGGCLSLGINLSSNASKSSFRLAPMPRIFLVPSQHPEVPNTSLKVTSNKCSPIRVKYHRRRRILISF